MTTQLSKRSIKRDRSASAVDRSEEICRIAAEIFCEKGFDAASMNEIASAVNLTKAGLYHYTTGKQDLLYRIIDYAMTLVEERVVAECLAIDDAIERLEQIIRNHVSLVVDGGESVSILSDEVDCLPANQRREIIRRKRRYLIFVRETLRELQAVGQLRDLDPDIAALNLLSTILGIPRWYRRDGRLTSREIPDEIVRFLFGGLLRA